MKKIFLVALLMVGTIIIAQEGNKRKMGENKTQFTIEQKSQLMLKKMTLELDLNDAQQKEFKTIIADKMAKMEAHKTAMKARKEKGVKPTNDERFEMANKKLDDQIATKKRMEKILNPKQFEKWTALKESHKGDRMAKRGEKKHGNNKGKQSDTCPNKEQRNG